MEFAVSFVYSKLIIDLLTVSGGWTVDRPVSICRWLTSYISFVTDHLPLKYDYLHVCLQTVTGVRVTNILLSSVVGIWQ